MSFVPIPCPPGSAGGGGHDEEQLLLCDVLNGDVVGTALAVYEYDEQGNPVGAPTFVIPGTNDPYVVQGVLQPCPEGSVAEFVLCDIQPDGSSTQFVRKMIQSPTGQVLEVHDLTMDGAVYAVSPSGIVGLCDPYSTCTPTADQDLAGDCGPGESPTQSIISADKTHPLSNSVYVDDSAADGLCGGTWDNPAAALPAGFPVDETFRNATYDQPGPVTQGTAPYPQLTAGAPINDGAGAGWLRVSDINSGTNGIWQVPTPFSTAQGMTAGITLASHDGTIPGGDGAAFVFTDGSVAPQSIPIGGFGNLGLNNWDGGYVAVVLDEYGQSCTCDHTPHGTVSPNPGPCGFCSNTISIQLAGAARQSASCSCCTIVQQSLNPKAINQTTRAQPLRLITSIIEEGGQTYVSASIDWNDGNGPQVYFDRVNVTACAGPPPANLRMAAFGGSGGAYRAIKEFRDAEARPAGESHWRAFPIVHDPIPACTTLVNISGSVDITFNSDTQTSGNGDPEAYFWLVDESTGTVIKRAEKSSIPAQVGTPTTLKWTASVTPAQLANLMVYVGSESRDQSGEYDTLWENLKIDVSGTGCPAPQRRTLEISARCPIPVVMAASEGSGGGTTVVNTPSTFEDTEICMEINGVNQSGFRREIHAPDGTITVTFIGADGLPQTPTTWFPGSCTVRDPEIEILCDDNGEFIRVFTFDENGNIVGTDDFTTLGAPYVPVGTPHTCGLGVAVSTRCFFDNSGIPFTRAYIFTNAALPTTFVDFDASGVAFVPAAGPLFPCDARIIDDREQITLCDDNGPFIRVYGYNQNQFGTAPISVDDYDLNGAVYAPVGVVHECPVSVTTTTEFDIEEEILCDNNGPFIRRYTFNGNTGVLASTADFTLAGAVYVPVGTVGVCDATSAATADVEYICMRDNTGARFYRGWVFTDTSGVPTSVGNFLVDGTPYVPVPPLVTCDSAIDQDAEGFILCDDNGPFVRRHRYSVNDGTFLGSADFTLAGAAYVPVGTVGVCAGNQLVEEVLCDDNGGFLRRFLVDVDSGAIISTTDLLLNGTTPYVTVGTVRYCFEQKSVRSQHFEVTNATPWTPALITGTATSVSVVVLNGQASITDFNGTVINNLGPGFSVTWENENEFSLSPPLNVSVSAGGRVYVAWTERV